MNDQYRIIAPAPPRKAATSHYKLTSTVLWIGLGAGCAFNLGLQLAGMWVLAIPFGAVAAVCAVALIVRAVAGKRR